MQLTIDCERSGVPSDSDNSTCAVQRSIIKFAFLVTVRSQSGLPPFPTPYGVLKTLNNVNKPSLTKNSRRATAQLRLRKAVLGDARYG